jgi:hypothetical protein
MRLTRRGRMVVGAFAASSIMLGTALIEGLGVLLFH